MSGRYYLVDADTAEDYGIEKGVTPCLKTRRWCAQQNDTAAADSTSAVYRIPIARPTPTPTPYAKSFIPFKRPFTSTSTHPQQTIQDQTGFPQSLGLGSCSFPSPFLDLNLSSETNALVIPSLPQQLDTKNKKRAQLQEEMEKLDRDIESTQNLIKIQRPNPGSEANWM